MNELSEKYIYETNSEENIRICSLAQGMFGSIQTAHSHIIRPFLKHRDLSDEQYKIVEEVEEKLKEHFYPYMDIDY